MFSCWFFFFARNLKEKEKEKRKRTWLWSTSSLTLKTSSSQDNFSLNWKVAQWTAKCSLTFIWELGISNGILEIDWCLHIMRRSNPLLHGDAGMLRKGDNHLRNDPYPWVGSIWFCLNPPQGHQEARFILFQLNPGLTVSWSVINHDIIPPDQSILN